MASIFTRALDRITPWDRGGEVQRRVQRKKKQVEEEGQDISAPRITVKAARPTQRITVEKQPKPQQPTNIFENLNKNLTLNQPQNTVPILKNPDVQTTQLPQPGAVVEPTKPKQSLGNRFRDVFDANTEADKYRRTVSEASKIEGELNRRGVDPVRSRATAIKIARSNSDADNNAFDIARNQTKDTAFDFIGKPVKQVVSNPIESGRTLLAQATGNKQAERMANRRQNVAIYRKEGADAIARGERPGWLSGLVAPAGDALAVIPLLKAASLATLGAREAVAARTLTPLLKGGLAGLDEATLGLRNFFKRPTIVKDVQGIEKNIEESAALAGGPDQISNLLSEDAVKELITKNIPVGQDVPVRFPSSEPVDVPVRNANTPRSIIQEVSGDAKAATTNAEAAQNVVNVRRAEAAKNADIGLPDASIEGITPRTAEKPFALTPETVATGQDKLIDDYAAWLKQMGEGNGVTMVPDGAGGYTRVSDNVRFGVGSKRLTKGQWRDEAERQLREGKADPSIQKAFNDAADPEVQALLNKGEQPDTPVGRPIKVQEAKGIPVRDETVIPQGLPEKPGTVRATTNTEPMNAKTKAVAETQQVYTDSSKSRIPVVADTANEYIINNPKQFTKRQVASARNQRKLARQMAKTQEDTNAAMQRIEASKTNPGAGQSQDFAPTGEFRQGKKGNVYETANMGAETSLGRREMADRSVEDLASEIAGKKSIDPGDARKISAAKENILKADPENGRSSELYQLLDRAEKAGRTKAAQIMALVPRTVRKTASADTLTARWERKIGNILDDPSRMTDGQWKEVQAANDTFTSARDRAGALEEQFRKTGSEADYKAWEQAHNAARDADTMAKMTEVKVAQQILKGEKGANVTKTIDAMKKEADVNTMDATSAAMLSGTGTGFRNTFGTELMGVENRLFANTRSKITKGLFGENVGGFDRRGARLGRKIGGVKWVGDMKRRAEIGGKNPLEWAKNWATTINSGGESSLQSQVYSRLGKYYKNQFVEQGLSGKDLDLRMRHAMLTDPDEMGSVYLDGAMKSSGLTGLFEKGQTIEKAVTDYVGRGTDSKLAQGASKLIMRMAVGFPTATTNFLYQSGKRLTLGLPSWIETGAKIAKGDKAGAAMAFDRGMKEAGSGGAMLGLGAALGSAGVISGSYPEDDNERERWTREGISENSIKIGGAWYPIPQGAGMLGLPLMVGAAIGSEGDSNDSLKKLLDPKSLSKLLPTDQIQGFLNTLSGDESPQALKNIMASTVRAATPAGALLNQIAKSFDPTKNDTSQHGLFHNVLDQVISGIPGLNNMVDIADKTDAEGNPISNPNALELAAGATSDVQGGGEQRSQEIDQEVQSKLGQIDRYGLLNDKNLDGILEGSALEAYVKVKSKKKLDESDIKALKEGLVKGVSSEGTDTAYLEREQYDTNLAVLKLKRDLMQDDPTVKPSSMKDVETAIKRGEVYKKDKIPYEDISDYQSIGVDEWRKMGDPESDEYDPAMYNKLYQIDQKMTKAGVSYAKGKPDKPKYTLKEAGKGKGGTGSKNIDTSFGKLKDGSFAPRVQQYDTIEAKAGNVPIIRRVRPNIVHKITSS